MDGAVNSSPVGTPAKFDDSDDFFSSWDKPTIKRPSNPPSRTVTPPIVGRASSPYLSAHPTSGTASRPKSPLASPDVETPESPADVPTVVKSTPAPATARVSSIASAGPRKGRAIVSGKKKLGAKKVLLPDDASDDLFELAEKEAKKEAEQQEALAKELKEAEKKQASNSLVNDVQSPPSTSSSSRTAPASSSANANKTTFSAPKIARLGFGQVGSKAGPASQPQHVGKTGISSSEFHGRQEEEDEETKARKHKLRTEFKGASGIGSADLHGEREDMAPRAPAGFGSAAELEAAAVDYIRQLGLTTGDDLRNLTEQARGMFCAFS